MDRAITASDANQHFSEMLRDVQRGEAFVVTSRGRPVARVVPVDTVTRKADVYNLLLFLDGLPRRSAGAWSRDDLYE